MQELRFVRGEDGALVVASVTGENYRVVVDEAMLSEIRRLSRKPVEGSKVRPREIQALVRGGKSRDEISRLTGADIADIERFEGPVLAERQYILDTAHRVPVLSRGQESPEEAETFGQVIAERLVALSADTHEWSSWKDDEAGWMISLEFISHDVAHRALWSFEHRKQVLGPLNDDAVRLSKQGEIGERLIPKLRAVDVPERTERFDSDAFGPDDLPRGPHRLRAADPLSTTSSVEETDAARSEPSPETPEVRNRPTTEAGTVPTTELPREELLDPAGEYARRQHIDERAVTRSDRPADLGQTADLLQALRRRRGERDVTPIGYAKQDQLAEDAPQGPSAARTPFALDEELPPPLFGLDREHGTADRTHTEHSKSDQAPRALQAVEGDTEPPTQMAAPPAPAQPTAPKPSPSIPLRHAPESPEKSAHRKRRAEMPSWDDILFGTRNDDDPA